jgi:hypothetical protein
LKADLARIEAFAFFLARAVEFFRPTRYSRKRLRARAAHARNGRSIFARGTRKSVFYQSSSRWMGTVAGSLQVVASQSAEFGGVPPVSSRRGPVHGSMRAMSRGCRLPSELKICTPSNPRDRTQRDRDLCRVTLMTVDWCAAS